MAHFNLPTYLHAESERSTDLKDAFLPVSEDSTVHTLVF